MSAAPCQIKCWADCIAVQIPSIYRQKVTNGRTNFALFNYSRVAQSTPKQQYLMKIPR